MSVTTLLFDVDGTLVESTSLIVAGLQHAAEEHLGVSLSDSALLTGLGIPIDPFFRQFTDDPETIRRMRGSYSAFYERHVERLETRMPGVTEMLADLARVGTRLAAVTSKDRAGALDSLRRFGLIDYFEVVISSDDVSRPKPAPDPVRRALDLLGARAAETWFIGDSPYDLASGRAAGVTTVAALWGPFSRARLEVHSPDHWLTAPGDVLGLVRRARAT